MVPDSLKTYNPYEYIPEKSLPQSSLPQPSNESLEISFDTILSDVVAAFPEIEDPDDDFMFIFRQKHLNFFDGKSVDEIVRFIQRLPPFPYPFSGYLAREYLFVDASGEIVVLDYKPGFFKVRTQANMGKTKEEWNDFILDISSKLLRMASAVAYAHLPPEPLDPPVVWFTTPRLLIRVREAVVSLFGRRLKQDINSSTDEV